MTMNSPNIITWMLSVLCGLVGVLIQLDVMSIPALEDLIRPFWLVTIGFSGLALGNVFKWL